MEREAKFGMLVNKGMRKGRGYAPGPRQRRGFCLGPRGARYLLLVVLVVLVTTTSSPSTCVPSLR